MDVVLGFAFFQCFVSIIMLLVSLTFVYIEGRMDKETQVFLRISLIILFTSPLAIIIIPGGAVIGLGWAIGCAIRLAFRSKV